MTFDRVTPDASPVDFDAPPVAEVALAVQFDGSVTDETTILSEFWPRVAAQFPIVESQPALPPMFEDFGVPQPQVMFQVGPSSPRYWFQSEDRRSLLQVQHDRFAYNWRGELGDGPYPRYPQLRASFFERYGALRESSIARGMDLTPTWCEVTYINPVEVAGPLGPDLADLLHRVRPFDLLGLGTPEDTNLHERYTLERDGVPYGRFSVSAAPAVRFDDGAKLVILTLTARGLVAGSGEEGIGVVLDEGHELIVRGFKAMTTEAMHQHWGVR